MILHSRSAHRRRGIVLLAVMVIIILMSLAAYKYNDWMVAEYRVASSSVKAAQARAFALSGVHYAAGVLSQNLDETLGGNPFDNPEVFQDVEVPSSDEFAPRGRFSIVSLRAGDDVSANGQAFQFGVCDEGGKLNLNALLQYHKRGDKPLQILLGLPGMTEDVANAILDWLDADSTPRTNGAEDEHYGALSPPYRCKNGPLDSLEELLLVKGVTPELLFGNDRNRNGIIDENEGDGGTATTGWSAYLTVYSREMNVGSNGKLRINLNDQDLQKLSDALKDSTIGLGDDLATFILAARVYGTSTVTEKSTASDADLAAAQAKIQEDVDKAITKSAAAAAIGAAAGNEVGGAIGGVVGGAVGGAAGSAKLKRIRSIWTLVNAQVSVSVKSGRMTKTVKVPSPLNDSAAQRDLLPKLFDFFSTSANVDLRPRINVNTAPQAVLATLREVARLSDGDVQTLVSKRPDPSGSTGQDPLYRTPAWLLTEAGLKTDTLRRLERYLTTQSQVFRLQSVGYYEKDGPTARLEAVIDTNQYRPRIVYFRDLSELGKGFDVGAGQQ